MAPLPAANPTESMARVTALQDLGQRLAGQFLQQTGHRSIENYQAFDEVSSQMNEMTTWIPSLLGPWIRKLSKEHSKHIYKATIAEGHGIDISLHDFNSLQNIKALATRYGQASHMGIRDQSYKIFINQSRTGALLYKPQDNVAVIVGDPMCHPALWTTLIDEFEGFCQAAGWHWAMAAASPAMTHVARKKKWISMHFGIEKVLNPSNNPILFGKAGKRIVTQCKQLLRNGTSVQLYCPWIHRNTELESELSKIYDEWREEKNCRDKQAYITVFDLFAFPNLMIYIYTTLKGTVNGFAALRKLGQGYHIDPFIATPEAPRGVCDLLMISSMAFLNQLGVSRLSLGFDPMPELGEVNGMSSILVGPTRKVYHHIFGQLPLQGKEGFFNRFRPDESQELGAYIIIPKSLRLRHFIAITHFANISIRKHLVNSDIIGLKRKRREKKSSESDRSEEQKVLKRSLNIV